MHANSLVAWGTVSNVTEFDSFGYHSRLLSPLVSIRGLNDNPQPYFGSQHLGVIYNVFPNLIIANSPVALEFLYFMPGASLDTGVLYCMGMANTVLKVESVLLTHALTSSVTATQSEGERNALVVGFIAQRSSL